MIPVPTAPLLDPARIQDLNATGWLDTPPEARFDRLVRLAAQTLRVPRVALSLVDDHRQFFKACQGLPEPVAQQRETPLQASFCRTVVETGEPLIIDDARRDERWAEHPGIQLLATVAYLGVPLRSPRGWVLGSFCVMDSEPRKWTNDEVAQLLDYVALVETELRLEESLREQAALAARRQALLDQDIFALISADLDGVIRVFSRGAEKMLGYRAEEVLGTCTPLLFHVPEELAARRTILERELAHPIGEGFALFTVCGENHDTSAREWTYVRKDGSRLPVLLRVTTMQHDDGEIFGYLGVALDITEHAKSRLDLRKALDELATARDQALEASRLKSEFLSTISHEVRTPLNAVMGMTELLQATHLNAEQRDYLRTLQGGNESLLAIINDMLDFSRLEAGAFRLAEEPFALGAVIEQAVAIWRPQAEGKGLALRCNIGAEGETWLRGDGARLRQVLGHLLANAVKFTDVGEVEVTVRRMPSSADKGRFLLRVRDTGIGIAAEDQKRLFQPFTQVDGSSTRRHGGTGLGLAFCRQVMTLMGGAIGFSSLERAGSTFWIEVALPEVRKQAARPVADPAHGGAGRRVLLVEDNETNQKVARLLLEKMGYSVAVAGHGREALEKLRSGRFALVLMDCQMPVMDGYEASRRIRAGEAGKEYVDVPIFAQTAYARQEDRDKCLESGMSDHLSKPLRSAELERLLQRYGLTGPLGEHAKPVEEARRPFVDTALLRELAELYDPEGRPLIEELTRCLEQAEATRCRTWPAWLAAQDAKALASSAHAYAGVAAAVGGETVRAKALEIEQRALSGEWEGLEAKVAEMEAEVKQLQAVLRPWYRP